MRAALTLAMSLQVFLQVQLLGSERFLTISNSGSDGFAELAGRCGWLSLISEVLPRALLAEMKLSRMLLGSGGGEQFLLVLTDESIHEAETFLRKTASAIAQLSGGTLKLTWASTENLGPWAIVRKRISDELEQAIAAPLREQTEAGSAFAPFEAAESSLESDYFAGFGRELLNASRIGWSPEEPARLTCDGGTFQWPLRDSTSVDEDAVTYPRRYVLTEDQQIASPAQIAAFAEGAQRWAILRGDVDHFESRLKRTDSVEEHIHLSVLFKEFFAGELSVLCTLPEFWRKVTILYRGGDDFAVIGTWDALVALARELQRVFEKFAARNLQSFAGLEGKSISMALAVAPNADSSAISVFEQAGLQLEAAKASEMGTFHLFGRTLEWKRLSDAEELKNGLVRLVKDFDYSAEYIHDLASVYRDAYSAQATRRAKAIRVDKPWRTYMRLSRIIPVSKQRDLNQLRSSVITNLIGTNTANAKLRPSGRVGLEWARLATENQ
jgi:CRISPR-associated protein Csm1